MDDKDKKIAALEKDVTLLKKQLAQAVRALTQMEKKMTRVYHDHNNVARTVQNISAQLSQLRTLGRSV